MQGRTLQVTLAHDSDPPSGIKNHQIQHQPCTSDQETISINDRKYHNNILHATEKYSKPQEGCKANGVPAQPLNKNHNEKKHHDKVKCIYQRSDQGHHQLIIQISSM